jgi:hypothetical protein
MNTAVVSHDSQGRSAIALNMISPGFDSRRVSEDCRVEFPPKYRGENSHFLSSVFMRRPFDPLFVHTHCRLRDSRSIKKVAIHACRDTDIVACDDAKRSSSPQAHQREQVEECSPRLNVAIAIGSIFESLLRLGFR